MRHDFSVLYSLYPFGVIGSSVIVAGPRHTCCVHCKQEVEFYTKFVGSSTATGFGAVYQPLA